MGYACPVCDTPQRDGEHLAHHLAFTAMLHGGDHEAWLDDRVPDWSDREPAGLAAAVTPYADDAEYHEVFEDTVDRGRPDIDRGRPDIDHGQPAVDRGAHDPTDPDQPGHAGHTHAAGGGPKPADSTGEPDPEVAEALREARAMAREAGAGDTADDAPDDTPDSDAPDGPSA